MLRNFLRSFISLTIFWKISPKRRSAVGKIFIFVLLNLWECEFLSLAMFHRISLLKAPPPTQTKKKKLEKGTKGILIEKASTSVALNLNAKTAGPKILITRVFHTISLPKKIFRLTLLLKPINTAHSGPPWLLAPLFPSRLDLPLLPRRSWWGKS